MENTLYSNVLATSMNTFIIEGVCVKDREGDKNVSLSEILRRISNFENIGIQSGNIVSIYCTEDTARVLKHNLYMDSGYQYKQSMREAIQNGTINIFTPKHVKHYRYYRR